MKLNTATFLDTNLKNSTNFSIKAGAHAFRVLSKDLYQSPKLAIVRELACNAWDAHVQAQKEATPFEVWLPSSTSPDLIIKDYGVGLSPKAIETLYTTYFDSDKNHSNELIGGFGLGSKTPFAYTDQFTVISRFNGQLHTYHAFVDGAGTPNIANARQGLDPLPTSEENGLEVRIPAQPGDFEETLHCLRWFSTPPIVYGGDIPEICWLYKTDNYGVVATDNRNNRTIRVVMGNVAYKTNVRAYGYTKIQMYLFVPIGTYTPQVSREALSDEDNKDIEIKATNARRDYQDHLHSQWSGMSRWGQWKQEYSHRDILENTPTRDWIQETFTFATQKNFSDRYDWGVSRQVYEREILEGNIALIEAKPNSKHVKVAEQHFGGDAVFVKGPNAHCVFPHLIDPLKYKVTKEKSAEPAVRGSAYGDIYLNDTEVAYKDVVKQKHYSVEHYSRRRQKSRSYNRHLVSFINRHFPDTPILFVPNTEMLKSRFERHAKFEDVARKLIENKWPELNKYSFSMPSLGHITTFCGYKKYNRACKYLEKEMNYIALMESFQNTLQIRPKKPYCLKRLYSLYCRLLRIYEFIPLVGGRHWREPDRATIYMRRVDQLRRIK